MNITDKFSKKAWGKWLIIGMCSLVLCAQLFLYGVKAAHEHEALAEHHHAHALPAAATHAASTAVIDVQSGRLIVSHHGDKPMLIASLTKIMTAIVAIEHGNLADKVTVSERAYRKEGSSIYLELHEEMSLEHLLYGLMLRSGNDAATAIAEHVGGSEEGFAFLMNEKARSIGMHNSNFVNPHGLNAKDHYSTANDMALLTAYALKNPVFSEIVRTKVKKVANPNREWDYTWYNKNKMLSFYEGGNGVKTGYTKLAGRCLVSSATRGGIQLAVVTLNDPTDWVDHMQLLDYGFANFSQQQLIEKGDPVDGYPYVAGRTFHYFLTEEELVKVTTEVSLLQQHTAHYQLGERGTLQFKLGGTVIGAIPIYERNSPQLKLKHRSTFSFRQSDVDSSEHPYLQTVQSLLKALFNG